MLNAERLSVLALVREAIVENQVKAESKHINLVLSLNGKQKLVHVEGAVNAVDEDDLFINADHETIKTAVKNLVENAINYSPEHTTVAVGIGSGSYFRAILPCRSRTFPRNRGYRIGFGHHQTLRAGLRRHYRRVVV